MKLRVYPMLLIPVMIFLFFPRVYSEVQPTIGSASRIQEVSSQSPDIPSRPSETTSGLPEQVSSESLPLASGPQTVKVGVYLENVNDIDVKSSIYMLDFYIWFRWTGSINPTETFEFQNLVESWAVTKQAIYQDPEALPDGSFYQCFRVQGKFNRKFDLANFPLDQQELIMEIEDSRHQSNVLVFDPDLKSSGLSPRIKLPGWQIRGFRTEVEKSQYSTDFGRPVTGSEEAYTRFRFALDISRPTGAYLFRLLFPLVIVLLTSFVVFFLPPGYGDARTSIALTALLSIVALHLTASADLPQVGYLRLIDKLYNFSYVISFITLLESVWALYLKDHGQEAKAIKIDQIAGLIILLVTTLGMTGLLIFH